MVSETAVTQPMTSVLEAIQPFLPDDGHKGTFLVMRIAGMEQGTTLRIINRKHRSLQNWRSTDPFFKRIDDFIPQLTIQFGGEARVLRTALLDISVVETGIAIFKRILSRQVVRDSEWAYAVKMAGLRVPMMVGQRETNSPWEKLANSIKTTLSQRELTVKEEPNGTRSITAKEVVIQPSAEQKQMANSIVQEMLDKAGVLS